MKKLNTLVIASLVAGLTAPVLADTIIKDPVREKYLYGENIVVPVLNDCATSMPLPMGTTTWYGTDHARLWFVWVGSGSGLHLETYFPATNYDTDIRIFAANCTTQLFYKDGPSAQGYRTNLQCADFTFAAGTVYYIRIDEYLNSNIDPTDVCQMFWEDCAPPPPPPANDVASGAYPLELGACVDGDTNAPYTDNTGGYMDDSHLLCPGSTGAAIGSARDAWYYVVLNHAGLYTFDLTGSAYDTVLGVFDANGNLVASNDDFMSLQSKIECCQLPAGTYWVAVDGYSTSSGAFHFCVSECPPVGTQDVPDTFTLGQNVPNPFNPTTTIAYGMPNTGRASLKVYDVAGHVMTTLVNGMVERGQHTVTFDAGKFTSGVYFYTFESNGFTATRKMVLMK